MKEFRDTWLANLPLTILQPLKQLTAEQNCVLLGRGGEFCSGTYNRSTDKGPLLGWMIYRKHLDALARYTELPSEKFVAFLREQIGNVLLPTPGYAIGELGLFHKLPANLIGNISCLAYFESLETGNVLALNPHIKTFWDEISLPNTSALDRSKHSKNFDFA